ncbi:DUF2393 family protein [Campylobacter sp. RM12920]|uniref:DUF2393 family protein n=1 Tax=Campylobacter californiensis TaxID=1032243 RepID=A0ABD4JKQ0_9BACT|nr:DUF2393 family protein [Campylobacter sp. RM12919]MBE2988496.1 DUF2393 family protein [Campylobacter sp. RM12920]
MINSLKHDILFILANSQAVDYLSYGWVFIAFLFILFVGIFFALKSWWQIGFLIILLGLISFFVANFYVHQGLKTYLRPTVISDVATKQLTYSNTLIADFNITNESNKSFKICKIDIGFYMRSKQEAREFLNSLNPFFTKTIILKEPFVPKETKQIQQTINDFSFIEYKISKKAECF